MFYGVVYKLTNTVNGKYYIGQTQNSVEKRFRDHMYAKSAIGDAIREYGKDKFTKEILAVCESKKELNACEIRFIAEYKSNDPNFGYNRTGGGGKIFAISVRSGKIITEAFMSEEKYKKTGLYYVMKIIKGKYKAQVLYKLREFGVVRFGEMKRYLGDEVSYRMLASTLKELAADDLIIRTAYDENPPKVEYSLTVRGKSLIPLLDGLCAWGDANKPALEAGEQTV